MNVILVGYVFSAIVGLTRAPGDCITMLPGDANFIKKFELTNNGRDTLEYSYVFTKGRNYHLQVCGEVENMRISIYNYSRELVFQGSLSEERVQFIKYLCGATGIYYLQFSSARPFHSFEVVLGFSFKKIDSHDSGQ